MRARVAYKGRLPLTGPLDLCPEFRPANVGTELGQRPYLVMARLPTFDPLDGRHMTALTVASTSDGVARRPGAPKANSPRACDRGT